MPPPLSQRHTPSVAYPPSHASPSGSSACSAERTISLSAAEETVASRPPPSASQASCAWNQLCRVPAVPLTAPPASTTLKPWKGGEGGGGEGGGDGGGGDGGKEGGKGGGEGAMHTHLKALEQVPVLPVGFQKLDPRKK